MSLNDYAPTADEWKSWLLKPQWTAAEAAALSLGISPDLTKVSRQESHRPTDRVLSFGDEPPEEPIVIAYWNIVLEGKGRAAGLSTEKLLYLRTRDLAAGSLVSKNINLQNKNHWDFSVKQAPSDWIIQMQYWEWKLADGVLGIESTPDATPSKNTKSKEWYVGKWPDDVIYKNRVQVQRYLGIGRSSFYSKQRSGDLPKAENNGFYTKKSIDEAIAVTKARELANKEAEKAAKG